MKITRLTILGDSRVQIGMCFEGVSQLDEPALQPLQRLLLVVAVDNLVADL